MENKCFCGSELHFREINFVVAEMGNQFPEEKKHDNSNLIYIYRSHLINSTDCHQTCLIQSGKYEIILIELPNLTRNQICDASTQLSRFECTFEIFENMKKLDEYREAKTKKQMHI